MVCLNKMPHSMQHATFFARSPLFLPLSTKVTLMNVSLTRPSKVGKEGDLNIRLPPPKTDRGEREPEKILEGRVHDESRREPNRTAC